MRIIPTPSSAFLTVSGSSQQFATTLVAADEQYFVLSTATDLYFLQGANPTATAGANSTFLAAGQSCLVDGRQGAKLAVIQSTAGGGATLTRVSIK